MFTTRLAWDSSSETGSDGNLGSVKNYAGSVGTKESGGASEGLDLRDPTRYEWMQLLLNIIQIYLKLQIIKFK
jgi:hypothetical protein